MTSRTAWWQASSMICHLPERVAALSGHCSADGVSAEYIRISRAHLSAFAIHSTPSALMELSDSPILAPHSRPWTPERTIARHSTLTPSRRLEIRATVHLFLRETFAAALQGET